MERTKLHGNRRWKNDRKGFLSLDFERVIWKENISVI
jgi:hypothetical protein